MLRIPLISSVFEIYSLALYTALLRSPTHDACGSNCAVASEASQFRFPQFRYACPVSCSYSLLMSSTSRPSRVPHAYGQPDFVILKASYFPASCFMRRSDSEKDRILVQTPFSPAILLLSLSSSALFSSFTCSSSLATMNSFIPW